MIEDAKGAADQLRRYVLGLRKRDDFGSFLDVLNDAGEAYLFGGAPRDVVFGAKKHIHDLDIFVSGTIDIDRVSRFSSIIGRNNFGGFRLYVSKIDVDAWELQKSYPFIHKLSPYVSAMNLLRSVCFSTDGVAVSLKSGRFLRTDAFNKSMKYRCLDFVVAPREESSIVAARVARLVLKLDLMPARSVASYFLRCLDHGGIGAIIGAEERWGRHRMLNEIILEQIRSNFLSVLEFDASHEVNGGDRN